MAESVGEFEYHKKDLIGHGAFAIVFKGRRKKRPESPVAIKCISKKNLSKSHALLGKEIKILKELQHEHIVSLLDCVETHTNVYLVMEYCNGGDLADYLQAKGTLSEDTIRLFFKQIASAMKALHAKGIIHRDLKPQNLLLSHSRPNPAPQDIKIKIADFGFARYLQSNMMAATLCGSPMYMAPEVITSQHYDAKADLWSIGTIMFQCLTGKAPFQASSPQGLKHFYERNKVLIPNLPAGTSSALRDLLTKLLKRNHKERMDYEEFFVHPFICGSPTKPTSPVPVPLRHTSSSSSPSSKSSASPAPLPMGSSPLTAAGNLRPRETPDLLSSPQEPPSFLDVSRDTQSSKSSSDQEDFVMVPTNLPSDISAEGHLSRPRGLESAYSASPPRVSATPPSRAQAPVAVRTDSRPSSLPVHNPVHPPTGSMAEPVPVPSQLEAYHVIQQRRGSLPSPNTPPSPARRGCGTSPGGQYSSPKLAAPGVHRDKVKSTTPPQLGTALLNMNPTTLPTIVGSPTSKFPLTTADSPAAAAMVVQTTPGQSMRDGAVVSQLQGSRVRAITPSSIAEWSKSPLFKGQGSRTGMGRRQLSFGNASSLLRAAFGSPSGSTGGASSSGSMEVSVPVRSQGATGVSPPSSMSPPSGGAMTQFRRPSTPGAIMASSPDMEGPISFVAPELPEETLLEPAHNETLQRIHFALILGECIMEVAQSKGAPGASLTESLQVKQNEDFQSDQICFVSEGVRRAEQIVLYMRATQLFSSALQHAREEVRASQLKPSKAVKERVAKLNDRYKECIRACKTLHEQGDVKMAEISASMANMTADKLLYNHAVECCQGAALDELFGNPGECASRYRTALILLHGLALTIEDEDDRGMLLKYSDAVDKRLTCLEKVHQPVLVFD
ncbi:PREDICTED: serine/threonine-protein kinase unc-51-like [Branchiostoma belcheri]|uniref:non-specific serine/threonine protein kinase n=1 Tax=Branchiostoma belcheri TaxID=7741 RepID=A0A6P4YJI8_BRABE|nr:PREDICTED: serine/threonine-protein kinase unc-51-like [Branchiostoma belcheri]